MDKPSKQDKKKKSSATGGTPEKDHKGISPKDEALTKEHQAKDSEAASRDHSSLKHHTNVFSKLFKSSSSSSKDSSPEKVSKSRYKDSGSDKSRDDRYSRSLDIPVGHVDRRATCSESTERKMSCSPELSVSALAISTRESASESLVWGKESKSLGARSKVFSGMELLAAGSKSPESGSETKGQMRGSADPVSGTIGRTKSYVWAMQDDDDPSQAHAGPISGDAYKPIIMPRDSSSQPFSPPKLAQRLSPLKLRISMPPFGLRLTRSPSKTKGSKYGKDLSAFAMPLIGPDIAENMADSSDYSRSRSSSGSTALKNLLGSKSKSRNKSVEREDKKEKDKDKKKGFFEQFRPRSKSDVSGLKRPAKKSSLPTDRSMDETTLVSQASHKSFGGSQETITPMGQILEGQMLNVPEDERVRHKSGPSGYRDGGFMSKFRARSNSESKPKSPKRTLQAERSVSPPSSPRADRSGLSPLKFQSGEPRSAPPVGQRAPSMFSDHTTHAIIYKADVLNRLSDDSNRMEIEDLDENEDQVFAKFMRAHKCYDLIPTSAKLVIFDTQLNVKKAFFALIYNGVRAAPLWDSEKQNYVGMLTITDFIYILQRVYRAPDVRMDELEDHKIQNWREMVKEKQRPFVYIGPDVSLFEAIKTLIESHVHRLPVIEELTGNAIYILTHKRILRFLHLHIKELPQPSFMKRSIKDLGIGTYNDVMTTTPETPLLTVLNMFVEYRISALPVINTSGEVINIYAKFDVINLAADRSYNNLDITVGEALRSRQSGQQSEIVATCHQFETLGSVMEKIVKAEVHRLVVVDEENHVEGIVSLSDLLKYIVLRPMEAVTAAPVVEHTSLDADQAPLVVDQASSVEPDLMVTETPAVSS